jgi:hypothetical protein
MKTLSSVWTLKATGLLFLVNLFAVPLNLRAQDGAEFAPKTAHAVTVHADEWFQFISAALRGYGDDLLRDIPGVFDRLAQAQSERDAEYVTRMNTEHGFVKMGDGLICAIFL